MTLFQSKHFAAKLSIKKGGGQYNKKYNHRISVQQKVVSIITAVLKARLETRNLNFN